MNTFFFILKVIVVVFNLGLVGFMIFRFITHLCWKHFKWKTYFPGGSYSKKATCQKCFNHQTDPPVKCSCGWKGRLVKCDPKVSEEEFHFCCPICSNVIL